MRGLGAAVVAALALGTASPAHAGAWSLGANLDLTVLHPEYGHNTTTFAWPSSTTGYQPGIRIGVQPGGGADEIHVDTGYLSISEGGSNGSSLLVSANYQYNFSHERRFHPYLTVGGGVHAAHYSTSSGHGEIGLAGLYGGGFGVSRRVADDHGTLRIEGRYDVIGSDGYTALGLRMGFDLWFK